MPRILGVEFVGGPWDGEYATEVKARWDGTVVRTQEGRVYLYRLTLDSKQAHYVNIILGEG